MAPLHLSDQAIAGRAFWLGVDLMVKPEQIGPVRLSICPGLNVFEVLKSVRQFAASPCQEENIFNRSQCEEPFIDLGSSKYNYARQSSLDFGPQLILDFIDRDFLKSWNGQGKAGRQRWT